MKLIQPSEIASRILTLLDKSDERVIFVSPYIKISKWYKLLNKIEEVKARGIPLEIYVREDPENTATYEDLDHLELKYNKIPHLHCKLYLNERSGIVTSMNLLLSSEINSLEIGYATETWEEYNELSMFYHRYIRSGEPVITNVIKCDPVDVHNRIKNLITEELVKAGKNPWFLIENNTIQICIGRNNYSISIKEGYIRITVYLRIASGKRQIGTKLTDKLAKKVSDLTAMKVDVHPNPRHSIVKISGQTQQTLKSTSITDFLEEEVEFLVQSVLKYTRATDDLEI